MSKQYKWEHSRVLKLSTGKTVFADFKFVASGYESERITDAERLEVTRDMIRFWQGMEQAAQQRQPQPAAQAGEGEK